jgi:hypothetical protein
MTAAKVEAGVPQTAGWFILATKDAPWMHNDMSVRW